MVTIYIALKQNAAILDSTAMNFRDLRNLEGKRDTLEGNTLTAIHHLPGRGFVAPPLRMGVIEECARA